MVGISSDSARIMEFIEANFEQNPSLSRVVKTLTSFSHVLKIESNGENFYFLIELINDNTKLQSYLQILTSELIKQKTNPLAEKVMEDDTIALLVDIYCSSKDINLYSLENFKASDSNDPVKMYLNDISQYPLLTKDEEMKLFIRYSNNDKFAKEKLIQSNLRLVVSIAKRYCGRGIDFLDLIQEGNLGLIEAIEKFDYAKGFKLSTYATCWIKQKINRCINLSSNTIKIPINAKEAYKKLIDSENELLIRLGRKPTVQELALKLDISEDKVKEIKSYPVLVESLNSQISPDQSEKEFLELIGDKYNLEDDLCKSLEHKELWQFINGLTRISPRNREIFKIRYGYYDGRINSLQEIGDLFGLSRERVRQIEYMILRIIRYEYSKKEKLLETKRLLKKTESPEETNKSKIKNNVGLDTLANEINIVDKDNDKSTMNTETEVRVHEPINITKSKLANKDEIKTIYEYLPEYFDYEIDEAIKYLDDNELKLLYIVYGDDLKNPEYLLNVTEREILYIYNNIIKKIENKIIELYNLSNEELISRKRNVLLTALKQLYNSFECHKNNDPLTIGSLNLLRKSRGEK